MSIFTDAIAGGIASLINSISDTVDRFVQTPDEKARLNVELTKIAIEHQMAMVNSADKYEAELTKRQEMDLGGTWLTKNIRPMCLIFLLAVYTLMAVTDGVIHAGSFDFIIKPAYAEGFKSFAELALMFYFGGRSLEKVSAMAGQAFQRK